MSETLLIAKAIASVAMCVAISVGCWKTKSAYCLWALLFVAIIWR